MKTLRVFLLLTLAAAAGAIAPAGVVTYYDASSFFYSSLSEDGAEVLAHDGPLLLPWYGPSTPEFAPVFCIDEPRPVPPDPPAPVSEASTVGMVLCGLVAFLIVRSWRELAWLFGVVFLRRSPL